MNKILEHVAWNNRRLNLINPVGSSNDSKCATLSWSQQVTTSHMFCVLLSPLGHSPQCLRGISLTSPLEFHLWNAKYYIETMQACKYMMISHTNMSFFYPENNLKKKCFL